MGEAISSSMFLMHEARRGKALSRLSRALRNLHHIVFHASREGRASEIAAWANALASLALGAGGFLLVHSWPVAIATPIVAFVLLRVALTNRVTIWVAASFGTIAVAAFFGVLAWVFGHVVEIPAVPSVAGVLGAVTSATLPAWAYGRLAQRRVQDVRDSLIDPVSVPSSRS